MRYLVAAALCSTLVLAACGEDSRPAPMEPAPDAATDAIRCIKPGFPIKLALEQIAGSQSTIGLYPKSNPKRLALALARVAEVAALWTLCKPTQAQAKLAVHTNIVLDDFRLGRLIGGTSEPAAGRVITHLNTMWVGVGFPPLNPPVFPGTGTNFGVGLFTPGTPLLVKTGAAEGAVFLPANSFSQPTLVTILQRSNEPNPFAETGFEVLPPFYEIIASNASNTHYLTDGVFAVVGFCVDDVATPIFSFGDPAIAHIAVTEGANAGGFEILTNASSAQYAALGLSCAQYTPPIPIGSLFHGGLRRFASAAPRYLSDAAASLLLPAELDAAVGKTGLGGLPRSLSPFGVTDRSVAIDYGATGYRYLPSAQFAENTEGGIDSTDFHSTAYDDSGWNTGDAAFGSGPVAPNNCPIQTSNPQQTFWPPAPDEESQSDMLVRKQFFFPATGYVSATISIAIDNDVQVYVNGNEISDGLEIHDGCATQGSFTFLADGEVLETGLNLLAIRGRDRGGESYLDVQVTLNPEFTD